MQGKDGWKSVRLSLQTNSFYLKHLRCWPIAYSAVVRDLKEELFPFFGKFWWWVPLHFRQFPRICKGLIEAVGGYGGILTSSKYFFGTGMLFSPSCECASKYSCKRSSTAANSNKVNGEWLGNCTSHHYYCSSTRFPRVVHLLPVVCVCVKKEARRQKPKKKTE